MPNDQLAFETIEDLFLSKKKTNALCRIYGGNPFYYEDIFSEDFLTLPRLQREAIHTKIQNEIKSQINHLYGNLKELLSLNQLLSKIPEKKVKRFFSYLKKTRNCPVTEQPYLWGPIKNEMERMYTLLVNYLVYFNLTKEAISRLIEDFPYHFETEFDDPLLEKKLQVRVEGANTHISACVNDYKRKLFDALQNFSHREGNRKRSKAKGKRKYIEDDELSGEKRNRVGLENGNLDKIVNDNLKSPLSFVSLDQISVRDINSPFSQTIESETERENYHYWLQQHDIADIVRIAFHSYGEESEQSNKQFNIVSDVGAQLEIQLQRFKRTMRVLSSKTGRLTLIINLENQHWVALVVDYRLSNFDAYYVDTTSDQEKPLPAKIKVTLEQAHIPVINLSILTQTDSFNCGLWAIENADRVNKMLDDDNLQERWVSYYEENFQRYNLEYFKQKRRYYANLLSQDEERKNFVDLFRVENLPELDVSIDCLASRAKRSLNEACLFSWEDVDHFNSVEGESLRNPNKIRIDSEAFIDYLHEIEDTHKREQLIQLVFSSEIMGVKKESVQQLIDTQRVKQYFSRLKKVSNALTGGFISKLFISEAIRGDYKGFALDLMVLGANDVLSSAMNKLLPLAKKLVLSNSVFLGTGLGIVSLSLRRGTSAFVVYNLVKEIKALQAGNKDVLANVVGDSIFIGSDLMGIGVEVLELGGFIADISAIAGPVSEIVCTLALLGTQIYESVKRVEAIDQLVHLTNWQKFHEGLRFFFGLVPETLIEEKMELAIAYQRLLQQAWKILQSHAEIKRYVLPALEMEKKCISEVKFYLLCGTDRCRQTKCQTNIKVEPHNWAIFSEKNHAIYKGMLNPNLPIGAKLFCFPSRSDGERTQPDYFCYKTIGIENSVNKKGNYTLFALGKGMDTINGFLESPNIFVVNDGFKLFYGGNKDDIFILQAYEVEGELHGKGGIDTLIFSEFSLKVDELEIYLSSKNQGYLFHKEYKYFSDPFSVGTLTFGKLSFFDINRLIGRPMRRDSVYVRDGTFFIDIQGGAQELPDRISISSTFRYPSRLDLIVRQRTEVTNLAMSGEFNYIFPISTDSFCHGQDVCHFTNEEQALLWFPINESVAKHHFFFNCTLLAVESIHVINNTTSNYNQFHFLPSPSDRFTVTLYNPPKQANYIFNGNTQIYLEEPGKFYALQKTNVSINTLIPDYLSVAKRLNISLLVYSSIYNEMLAIGHAHDDVIHNDLTSHKSHLIGGKGENIYVIGLEEFSTVPDIYFLPEVILYNFKEDEKIDTLDLCKIVDYIAHKRKQREQIEIISEHSDILIQVYSLADEVDKSVEGKKLIITIRLNNGLYWYKKLHILFNSLPRQLIYLDNKWDLNYLPLIFYKEKHSMVLTSRDIEKESKLIVEKNIGTYEYLRDAQDLIVTNLFHFTHSISHSFTLLLKNFYGDKKLQTLTIQFLDGYLSLKDEEEKINKTRYLHTQLSQFSERIYRDIFPRKVNEVFHKDVSHTRLGRAVQGETSYVRHRSSSEWRAVNRWKGLLYDVNKRDKESSVFSANNGKWQTMKPKTMDLDIQSALQLIVTILLKLTGRQFPSFQQNHSISLKESSVYAATIAERVECLIERAASKLAIALRKKEDQALWNESQMFQSDLRDAFVQGRNVKGIIRRYIDTIYLERLSPLVKKIIIKSIKKEFEFASTNLRDTYKINDHLFFSRNSCFYRELSANNKKLASNSLEEFIGNGSLFVNNNLDKEYYRAIPST